MRWRPFDRQVHMRNRRIAKGDCCNVCLTIVHSPVVIGVAPRHTYPANTCEHIWIRLKIFKTNSIWCDRISQNHFAVKTEETSLKVNFMQNLLYIYQPLWLAYSTLPFTFIISITFFIKWDSLILHDSNMHLHNSILVCMYIRQAIKLWILLYEYL